LYSVFDLQKDNRIKEVRGTQQQFSRYSTAISSSVNSAALQSNNIPLQKDNQVQIGIPYDDSKGETGASTQELLFSTYGSQYTFYTLQGDTTFAFDNLSTGRSIEFTLDITVDSDNVSSILITFPQVTNPPILAGDPGDRLILRFIGVNRTDPEGFDPPVQTFTFLTGVEDTGLGYSVIEKDGVAVTERNTMNFIGTGVTVVDNVGALRTDITIAAGGGGGEFFGPWTAAHDAGGFPLNNSGGIDMFSNSAAHPIFGASFINFLADDTTFRGALTRNDETPYTAFDTGLILDVPTNNSFSLAVNSVEKFKLDGTNNKLVSSVDLDMFDSVSGTKVARSILKTAIISFVSDGEVARGEFGRSDFFAGTAAGLVTNIPSAANYSITVASNTVFKIDPTNNLVTFRQLVSSFGKTLEIEATKITSFLQLDMNSSSITNALFVASNTDDRPGSGFLRMATDDQVIWRSENNDDNLFINAARPVLDSVTQDAFAFTVASGIRLYIGQFDISVQDLDIIKTGSIFVGSGTHQIGTTTNPYNQMFSQFFIPENANVITNRYGLSHTTDESDDSTTDQTYINIDGNNNLSNFAIKREGFTKALFRRTVSGTPSTYELFLGSFPAFESGETVKIQFGENSASSAEISFTEGANDLILNRQTSTVTTLGVKLQSGGIDRLYARAADVLLSVPLNMDTNEMTNVKNIFSDNDSGNNQIGALSSESKPGGFDYYVDNKIFWDTDADTFIEFQSNGINIISDDSIVLQSKLTAEESITIQALGVVASVGKGDVFIKASRFARMQVGTNIIGVQDNAITFSGSNANIFLGSGTKVITFADEVAGDDAPTPSSGDINLFNDATTGELSVKKFGGAVISLEGGGGSQTPWLSDINAATFDLTNLSNLEFRNPSSSPSAVTINAIFVQDGSLVHNVPNNGDFDFREGGQNFLVMDKALTTFSSGTFSVTSDVINLGDGLSGTDTLNVLSKSTFANNITLSNNVDILPFTDLGSDLGSTSKAFGTAYINEIVFDIAGKTIDSVGALDLEFEVPSGGDMKFREAGTEFWRLDGGANVSVFSRDIELDGSNRAIRAFDGTEIGFFVTNTGAAVGAQGSLQIPTDNSGVGNAAQANSDFGSALGCQGLYLSGGGGADPVYMVKISLTTPTSAGTWQALLYNAAGPTAFKVT